MPDDLVIDLDRAAPPPSRANLGRSHWLSVFALVAVALGLWVAQPAAHRPAVAAPFVPSRVSPSRMLAFGQNQGLDTTAAHGYAFVSVTNVGRQQVVLSLVDGVPTAPGLRVTAIGIAPADGGLPGDDVGLPGTWPLDPMGRVNLYIGFVRTCANDAPTVTVLATATGYGVTEPFSQRIELSLAGAEPTALPACAPETAAPDDLTGWVA
jgi:hypothetical protein